MPSRQLRRDLESLLFVSPRPLSVQKLAQLTGASAEEVERALTELTAEWNQETRGIQLQRVGRQVQLVSNPLAAKLVTRFLKEEQSGELTDPAIETLTIIAYRGPITKSDLDQIRGVNCSLILRHLLVRGLVEAEEDRANLVTRYRVTFDFLRFLGVRSVEELPDYEKLRHDPNLRELLAATETLPGS